MTRIHLPSFTRIFLLLWCAFWSSATATEVIPAMTDTFVLKSAPSSSQDDSGGLMVKGNGGDGNSRFSYFRFPSTAIGSDAESIGLSLKVSRITAGLAGRTGSPTFDIYLLNDETAGETTWDDASTWSDRPGYGQAAFQNFGTLVGSMTLTVGLDDNTDQDVDLTRFLPLLESDSNDELSFMLVAQRNDGHFLMISSIESGGPAQLVIEREKSGTEANSFQTQRHTSILHGDEQVATVTISHATVAEAQTAIDAQKLLSPNEPLVVIVSGVIRVSDTPLLPPSKTCFIFKEGGGILADTGVTASDLVLLNDVELVSFTAGDFSKPFLIDGGDHPVTGIRMINSGKIHIDGVVIKNCGTNGLNVDGNGDDVYADPVSLSRSSILNSGASGIVIRESSNFMCLDNVLSHNQGYGIDLDSNSAVLANNEILGNIGGVIIRSDNVTCSRNEIANNGDGVVMTSDSTVCLIYDNSILSNAIGARIEGSEATFYGNTFDNTTDVISGGSQNIMKANDGITLADIQSPGVSYFNPPTVANPHSEAVIWRGSGAGDQAMSRFDLTIDAAIDGSSAATVSALLASARANQPSRYLVVTLKGEFFINDIEGMEVPPHTAVLLYGKISNRFNSNRDDHQGDFELVKLKSGGSNSFSGGFIFSGSYVFNAISCDNANGPILIDGVRVDLSSPNGRVGALSTNAISTKGHRGSLVVRGCYIKDPGHRGFWGHVSSRNYIIDNEFIAGGFSVDFDAFCYRSAALYNHISDVDYHSGIFIEEGVRYNIAFGNTLRRCKPFGIQIHEQVTMISTNYNVVACNDISGAGEAGASGVAVSAVAPRSTNSNYIFNNRFHQCNGRSGVNIKKNTFDNYFAQNLFEDNDQDIVNYTTSSGVGEFFPQIGFHTPDLLLDRDGDGTGDTNELAMGRNPLDASDLSFEFNTDGDYEGWTNFSDVVGQQVSGGYLRGQTSASNGGVNNLYFSLDGTLVPKIAVRVRGDIEVDSGLSVFFKADNEPLHNRYVPYTGKGAWQTLTIDLGDHPNYAGGTITRLQLLPIRTADVDFEVDWIRSAAVVFPELMATYPQDDAGSVPLDANLSATFDVAVALGSSGNIELWETGGLAPIEIFAVGNSSRLSVGGPSVTIDPSAPLQVGKSYHVRIDSGAIENASVANAFKGIADATTWNFTADDTYAAWISVYGVTGAFAAMGEDHDDDGIKNAIENYFGTDPTQASRGVKFTGADEQARTYTFTHPKGTSLAGDLTAAYLWSSDLEGWHGHGETSAGSTVTFQTRTLGNGDSEVTARTSGVSLDELFVKIGITKE